MRLLLLEELYVGLVQRYSCTQIKGQTSNQYCFKDECRLEMDKTHTTTLRSQGNRGAR